MEDIYNASQVQQLQQFGLEFRTYFLESADRVRMVRLIPSAIPAGQYNKVYMLYIFYYVYRHGRWASDKAIVTIKFQRSNSGRL
jgi:hypothetical protein